MPASMAARPQSILCLRSLVLDLPPSCVEFCPAHPDYFVIGTYNLENEETTADKESDNLNTDGDRIVMKTPQSRNGSLAVYRIAGDTHELLHVQTVSYPSALLDLHFHPHQDKNEIFASISSNGSLSFFQLAPNQRPSRPLVEIATHKPLGGDGNALFLSCAWHPSLVNLLAITTSDHCVHILRVDETWNTHRTSSTPITTHALEVWAVAFSPVVTLYGDTHGSDSETAQGLAVYSGGDDGKLLTTTCVLDRGRFGGSEIDETSIHAPHQTINTRGHTAGVTAILPLPIPISDRSHILITGSYDDHARVFSIHPQVHGAMLRPPKLLAERDLGGGVWRLKLVKVEETDKNRIVTHREWSALVLASCMHAGCRILRITGSYGESPEAEVEVIGRFDDHKSMNYGSDYQPGTEIGSDPLRCLSTSFYDQLVCLWEF
ncbi:hypothetical protein GGS20DRAFT_572721 [Poronia punctata]|nr:hypothetical protein GGS20DRAFT_572721 [Poronia punctata]